MELNDLRELVQSFVLTNEPDMRIFCWGSSNYTAAKLYKLAFLNVQTPVVFKMV